MILGKDKKEQLDEKLIEKQYNIVKCVKCAQKFAFEDGKSQPSNLKDS